MWIIAIVGYNRVRADGVGHSDSSGGHEALHFVDVYRQLLLGRPDSDRQLLPECRFIARLCGLL